MKPKKLIPIFLILGSLVLAVVLTQQNQNLQNRAANETCLGSQQSDCFKTPCCPGLTCQKGTCWPSDQTQPNTIPCLQLQNTYKSECGGSTQNDSAQGIPCGEIYAVIKQSCQ